MVIWFFVSQMQLPGTQFLGWQETFLILLIVYPYSTLHNFMECICVNGMGNSQQPWKQENSCMCKGLTWSTGCTSECMQRNKKNKQTKSTFGWTIIQLEVKHSRLCSFKKIIIILLACRWWWWLFPCLQGFGEIVQLFPAVFFFLKWRLACAH